MTDLFSFNPETGESRMKRFLLMLAAFLARGVRWLRNPKPFILSCEGKNYAIPHRGRSLSDVKKWFVNYYQHAFVCPGCGYILLPGEKVSKCNKNDIAHHTIACAGNLNYLGVIGADGRVRYAYPEGRSMEEMAQRARAIKARDL